ncbi:MAG: helix-turn-helix domain-containing protein [Chloroflexota bacterium]|nr:helix-turn-helix domain-containing protein [Chloroflexota bacterium]
MREVPAPAPPETLTLVEISQRLGVSKTTAYELARLDALPVPTIRVGRRFLFSRRAFERLLAAQQGEQGEIAR